MEGRITPDNITQLKPGQVFVFGSNEVGVHGAGAARLANERFGAVRGIGWGLQGQSFAIPTKNAMIRTLIIPVIDNYVWKFLAFARSKPELTFLVTEVGCGLAGYKPCDIAPMFEGAKSLSNVHLPRKFWDVLNDKATR